MKYLGLFIVIVIAFWLFSGEDVWKGFYYPDGCLSCSENYIFSTEFETKEQCFDWADSLKMSRGNPNDLFECGLNCEEKDGFNVCEKTID